MLYCYFMSDLQGIWKHCERFLGYVSDFSLNRRSEGKKNFVRNYVTLCYSVDNRSFSLKFSMRCSKTHGLVVAFADAGNWSEILILKWLEETTILEQNYLHLKIFFIIVIVVQINIFCKYVNTRVSCRS